MHDEGHPEGLQSNGSERGREKSSSKRISLFPHNSHGKKGEAVRVDEEHKEVGDGWQEFRKGPFFSEGHRCRLLTPKDRDIYIPDFFRDSITHASIIGL